MYRQQHDPDVNVCKNTQNSESNKPIKEGTVFVLSDLTINNSAPDNCVAFWSSNLQKLKFLLSCPNPLESLLP